MYQLGEELDMVKLSFFTYSLDYFLKNEYNFVEKKKPITMPSSFFHRSRLDLEEYAHEPEANAQSLHALRRLVVGAKKEIALALVLSLLGILANTLSSITLKYVVDTALPNKDVKLLWELQGVFLVSVLLTSLFFILERHASYRIATRAQSRLRNELFSRIIGADYLTLQEQNTSEIINAMTYAVDGLEGVLSRCVTAVFEQRDDDRCDRRRDGQHRRPADADLPADLPRHDPPDVQDQRENRPRE